ncbi:MAG: DUF4012 domain-containing protein [Candidatus Kerfeldbacteria bacterium]
MKQEVQHDNRFDALQEVPPQNVLDLRKSVHEVEAPEPRSVTLERFWKEKSKRIRQPSPPRRQRPALQDVWGGFTMRTRAVVLRIRIGSFPIVAAVLLIVYAAIAGIGQVISTKNRIIDVAKTGYEALKVAGAKAESLDLASARTAFESASQSFATAESSFTDIGPVLRLVLSAVPGTGSKLRSGKYLVTAARHLADAGARFTTLAAPLTTKGEGFSSVAGFLKNIDANRQTLDAIVTEVTVASDELANVRSQDLPVEYREPVEKMQSAIPGLRVSISNLADGMTVMSQMFGVNKPSEYLYIFQNSNELRATGGFAGSFALIRIDGGIIKLLDAPSRGTLDVDTNLTNTVTPPRPLQVITPSWYFRDANWYPDFPTSAEQFMRFYRQARGFTPDGIVAFTPALIEQILAVTGPIELPEYSVTIDETNFVTTAQEQIEQKYDLRTNDPKQFIVDLIPTLADRLSKLDVTTYPALLATLARATSIGDLQVYSSDDSVQEKIVQLGWSGTMPQPDGDFFELVNTNIGGGKTDGVMRDEVSDHVVIATDGTVTVEVTVTRTHKGTIGDPFMGNRNRTYHRFYVPRGSRLVSTTGFTELSRDVYQTLPEGSSPDELLSDTEGRVIIDERSGTRINNEFGKTVFGNWTELDPGNSVIFSVIYTLPFTFTGNLERYDITIGKQAGKTRQSFELNVTVPDTTKVVWNSVDGSKKKTSSFSYFTDLASSQKVSLVLQKK